MEGLAVLGTRGPRAGGAEDRPGGAPQDGEEFDRTEGLSGLTVPQDENGPFSQARTGRGSREDRPDYWGYVNIRVVTGLSLAHVDRRAPGTDFDELIALEFDCAEGRVRLHLNTSGFQSSTS
jgi:hypothetical protein